MIVILLLTLTNYLTVQSRRTQSQNLYKLFTTVAVESASLNDYLIAEPPFLNNLCVILIRFQCQAFALATEGIPTCKATP